MNSLEEYLNRTESAVIKLFDGIDSYIKILRDSPKPIFTFGGNLADFEDDRKTRQQVYDGWKSRNEEAIKLSLEVQRDFLTESFALATLCGSVLQIAAMGIQWFSINEEIPEDLPEELKPLLTKSKGKPYKFCIGRRVRTVPIGLVIYAGRNQYNHMDDELKKLNTNIFNLLEHSYEGAIEEPPKDPAFDLENEVLINLSSNITSILEWKNYESYYADMHSLIAAT